MTKKKIVLPPVRVNSSPINVSYVKGDKIIIHKCDIDRAIKTIKACADPYGDTGFTGDWLQFPRE